MAPIQEKPHTTALHSLIYLYLHIIALSPLRYTAMHYLAQVARAGRGVVFPPLVWATIYPENNVHINITQPLRHCPYPHSKMICYKNVNEVRVKCGNYLPITWVKHDCLYICCTAFFFHVSGRVMSNRPILKEGIVVFLS